MSTLAIADMVSQARTLIDRPIDEVWPHLLNMEAWMKDFAIQSVEGEKNRVGELRKVLPRAEPGAMGVEEIHAFYFRTLKVTPCAELAYKAYTPHRGEEYSFTGVEVLRLQAVHSATVVMLDVYLEFQSERLAERALNDFVHQVKEGAGAIWERNFQRLSALATAS